MSSQPGIEGPGGSASAKAPQPVFRSVVVDARGRTVDLFDPYVRLWRDPPGLDFPQDDFRRVNARLREAVYGAASTSAPRWPMNVGVFGAGAIGLLLVFLGVDPFFLGGVVVAWIAFWVLVIGRYAQPQSSRAGIDGYTWRDLIEPHLSGISSLTVPVAVFIVASMAPPSSLPVPRRWVYALCALIAALAVFRIVAIERRRARTFLRGASSAQIADAMLAEGRCPACAYSIRTINRADDGCVVCPECGAAWTLPSD